MNHSVQPSTGFQLGQSGNQGTSSQVCVIGAGFAGLAVARTLRKRNVDFTMIDSGTGVGGLWHNSADKTDGPAYRSLHLNTSRSVTGYTDFPMPDDYPRYPRHEQVSSYLSDFAGHYDLDRSIELRTDATEVHRTDAGTWSVTTRNNVTGTSTTRYFNHLIVAAGQHWEPLMPEPGLPGARSFTGEQLHSYHYYEPSRFTGKKVLILGIGNSACDLAVELSRFADRTLISMRRGVHVVPKQMMGIPIDEIAASKWWSRMPFRVQRGFIEFLLRIIRGPITAYGIPQPDHRIFSAPVTISDELLSRISHGEIGVRPMITALDESRVHFADGSSDEIDVVIYCTGYQLTFPFLPQDSVFLDNGQVGLYQRVVPPKHSGLYFAGLIRPVGSITRLLETQAEWIADLIQGVAGLPDMATMTDEIAAHTAGAAKRYGTSAMGSIQIDFPTYLRAIRAERKAALRRTTQLGRPTPHADLDVDSAFDGPDAELRVDAPSAAHTS